MNLIHLDYLPGLALVFVVFAVVIFFIEKRFFRLVKTYWFHQRSIFSYLSTFLFISGMGLLLFSILDLRGPEEKIKTEVPKDRTIILIDTSASMLAEDVKPSRLQKAALIAKHFARKAAGHQLSIVAFAEIQKKIVPFTNDIDLIDARLDSLKNLRNQYGSSALTIAIQESIQYFQEQGEARGNILVITDGEETAEGINLKVPKEVHVALIGVGTTQGGRIPLDDSRGFRFGYKKDKGQDIVTKLNENFFKRVASDIPSSKYWIANSYTLPSDEVLEFFNAEKTKGLDQQDMVVKPVLMEWIVIPGILLLILSYLFKFIRVFAVICILIMGPSFAEEEVKISQEVAAKLEDLRSGKLSRLEKVKLADEMYKSGLKGEALTLYDENLDTKEIDKSIPPEAYLNYGTGLLENGKIQQGLHAYDQLLKSLPSDSPKSKEIKDMMDKNVVTLFKQQAEKKKKEEEDKKNKKDDNKDSKGQSGQGQGQSQDQKNQNQPQQGKGDKKEDKKKDEKKDDQNKEGKQKEGEKKPDDDEPKEDKKNEDQKANQGEPDKKPMPPKKLPAKLKQLMSDDRQLQMKMIENGTRELNKRKSRKSKDW